MSVRAYVPLTSSGLAALVAERRLSGPLRAHAVTAALVEAWSAAGGRTDDEDLEHAALEAAADDSWAARGAGDRPRRHVVAVDVTAVRELSDPDDPSAVELPDDVAWRQVASAHVDTDDQSEGADPPEEALAWFATQEVPGLV